MQIVKKNISLIIESLYLFAIFFLCQLPIRDFDIWFHLKSGELFVKSGHLFFTEPFSYAAQGRQWIPYEWLFQIVIYLLSLVGGIAILPFFIGIFIVISQFFLLRILGYIFRLPLVPRILLTFFFFVATYEYDTIRPHMMAYCFLIIFLFLIFARIFKGKKWVYLTPLITLVWTNLHSSVILGWGLLLSFGLVILIQWVWTKEKELLIESRDLVLLAIINFFITITPPLGLLNYQLLWDFYKDRIFLGQFIAEWSPTVVALFYNPFGFYSYTFTVIIAFLSVLGICIKKKKLLSILWITPLLIMGLVGFSAVRNIYLGLLGMTILFGWSLGEFLALSPKRNKWVVRIFFIIALVFLSYNVTLLHSKQESYASVRYYFPIKSTEFVKKYLHGNMFNDYNYGGYMLYELYPKQHIFIDGRSDVYRCCEMRSYQELSTEKYLSDSAYRKFLNSFWDKYDISFAVLSVQKHDVMRRIASLLNTDPNWSLVFWDDDAQIFVRKDGKNNGIIQQLGTTYATPYLRNPYVAGHEKEALAEYERMDAIATTAHTSNAIGYLLLKQGQFEQAQSRFISAMQQDPTFESPYMNLAELAAKDGNIEDAIKLYSQAKNLAPDRGLIYIRLGQLMQQAGNTPEEVKNIWQEGIQNTIDEDAKKQLQKLLQQI